MSGNELVGIVRAVFEWASLIIEVLGAGIIVAGVIKVTITRGTIRYLFKLGQPGDLRELQASVGQDLVAGFGISRCGGRGQDGRVGAHADQCRGARVARGHPHVPELVLKRMAAQAEADRKAAEEDCPFGKPDLLPKEKFKGRRWPKTDAALWSFPG